MTCILAMPIPACGRVMMAAGSMYTVLDDGTRGTMRKILPAGCRWYAGFAGDVDEAVACIEFVRQCVPVDSLRLEWALKEFCKSRPCGRIDADMIFCRREEIWTFDGKTKFTRHNTLTGIGSGAQYAIGFIYGQSKPLAINDIRRLLKRALRAAEALSGDEGPPFVTKVV